MNCSACRTRIGALNDGDLPARDATLVEQHLASCAACSAFAARLTALDAALVRLAPIEPRADFTLAVMAGISATPAPQRQPARLWLLVIADIALWLAIGALTAFGLIRWKAAVAGAGAFAAKAGVTVAAFFDVAQHFHIETIAVLGVGLEIAFLVILATAGRKYLPRVRATLSGVLS